MQVVVVLDPVGLAALVRKEDAGVVLGEFGCGGIEVLESTQVMVPLHHGLAGIEVSLCPFLHEPADLGLDTFKIFDVALDLRSVREPVFPGDHEEGIGLGKTLTVQLSGFGMGCLRARPGVLVTVLIGRTKFLCLELELRQRSRKRLREGMCGHDNLLS